MAGADVRRLTGPNLLLDGPGVVLDAACENPAGVAALVGRRVDDILGVLRPKDQAWQTVSGGRHEVRVWHEEAGFTLALPLPVDLLHAGCTVVEHAWSAAADAVERGEDPATGAADPSSWCPGSEVIEEVLAATADERDEALLRLLAAARDHGVAGVWDDDAVSLGLGRGSRTWARADVPHPDDVPWGDVHDVPVAMVTGTNGKSTTVRMLASVLRAAGNVSGHTSTDGVVVDGDVVDRGDWSGPGGARLVARDERVESIVLECARGGMLRSGLGLDRAEVAVVTNIAADHLGEYGIRTVEDLTRAKLTVARAVASSGVLVCNAEDRRLRSAVAPGPRVWWFSLDPSEARLADGIEAGGRGFTVEDGVVGRRDAAGWSPIVAAEEVPATHGGRAHHNVANVLAAVAAADALGVALPTISAALRGFGADPSANPGRGATFTLDRATVIVDYAHNEHGARALASWVRALDAERLLVLCSSAGDRDDEALDAYVCALHEAGVDRWVLADLPDYLRGRDEMEVPRVLASHLRARGVPEAAITLAASPVQGAVTLLDAARAGDLVLLLALQDRDELIDLLDSRGAVAQ